MTSGHLSQYPGRDSNSQAALATEDFESKKALDNVHVTQRLAAQAGAAPARSCSTPVLVSAARCSSAVTPHVTPPTRGEPGSFCSDVPAYPPPTLRGKESVSGASGYGQQEQNGTNRPDIYPDTFAALWPLANAVRVTSGFYASLLCAPYAAGGMGDAI